MTNDLIRPEQEPEKIVEIVKKNRAKWDSAIEGLRRRRVVNIEGDAVQKAKNVSEKTEFDGENKKNPSGEDSCEKKNIARKHSSLKKIIRRSSNEKKAFLLAELVVKKILAKKNGKEMEDFSEEEETQMISLSKELVEIRQKERDNALRKRFPSKNLVKNRARKKKVSFMESLVTEGFSIGKADRKEGSDTDEEDDSSKKLPEKVWEKLLKIKSTEDNKDIETIDSKESSKKEEIKKTETEAEKRPEEKKISFVGGLASKGIGIGKTSGADNKRPNLTNNIKQRGN
ncbi:hypothetical protein FACS1894152_3020 [Bacilli bacterium]|nr:hypothetical protein FACS1894152_3020 [Bacilli bacterium]